MPRHDDPTLSCRLDALKLQRELKVLSSSRLKSGYACTSLGDMLAGVGAAIEDDTPIQYSADPITLDTTGFDTTIEQLGLAESLEDVEYDPDDPIRSL